jgi:hypothetical protein
LKRLALFVLAALCATLVAVPVGAQVQDTTCPKGEYRAKYYHGVNFNTLMKTRCEPAPLNRDWGPGNVGPVHSDNVSVRYTGTFAFDAGEYDLSVTADDGVRLYVDGARLIDQWHDQSATNYTATKTLSAGNHRVKVEFYERTGAAGAKANWTKMSSPSPTGDCPTSVPADYVNAQDYPSVAAAVQSGHNIYFPAGNYSTPANVNLSASQNISGAGKDAVTISGEGFDLAGNNEVRCIGLAGDHETIHDAITFDHTGNLTSGNVIDNVRFFNYQQAVKSTRAHSVRITNSLFTSNEYGIAGNYVNTLIQGNTFDVADEWAAGEINGGYNIEIRNNTVSGGAVGFKFLRVHRHPWGRMPLHDVIVDSNVVMGCSQECLGTDMQGNENSAVREVGEVESASGNTVRLRWTGWSGSPYGNGKYQAVYRSGVCKGKHFRIASQAGQILTLESPTCVPAAGDGLVIGQPFYNFTFSNNIVDASKGLAAVDLWGFTYDSTISGNVVNGPDPSMHPDNPLLAAIKLNSLQGLATTEMLAPTPCGRDGPTDGITVTSNRIGSAQPVSGTDIIMEANTSWNSCKNWYRPTNTFSGNEIPVQPKDVRF